MKKQVEIQGMSCEHCLRRVQNALAGVEGVADIQIDLKAGTAEFTAPDSLSDEVIRETIDEAGYDVTAVKIIG